MAGWLSSDLCLVYDRYLLDRNSFSPRKRSYFFLLYVLVGFIILFRFDSIALFFTFCRPDIFLAVTPFDSKKGAI